MENMNPSIVPIGSLAVFFAVISFLWIAITLKEGRKAEAEIKAQRIKKAKNAPIEDKKKRLNKLLEK